MRGFPLGDKTLDLYEHLTAQVREKRQISYEMFLKDLKKIETFNKEEMEITQIVGESKWRMLPQQIEEWRPQNALSLFALRLKILVAELGKKSEEAKEAENQLSTAFQSLLLQWEAPPANMPRPLPEKKEILTPPPRPDFPPFWWKSPAILSIVPSSACEEELVEPSAKLISAKLIKEIEREKKGVSIEINNYKALLSEVRRRCPLP